MFALPASSRRRQPWQAGAASLLALAALLLLWRAVLADSACPSPERETGGAGSATLDRAHPWVEQRVVVSLDPEVVPEGIDRDAVVLAVLRQPDDAIRMEARSPIETFLMDDETGQVLARAGSEEANGNGYFHGNLPSVVLDCPPGQRCVRALRVVFVWSDPSADGSYPLSWRFRVQVSYPRALAPCFPPREGELTMVTDAPVVGGVDDFARTALPAEAAIGELTARHVTIRTEAGGTAPPASAHALRISVTRPASPSYGWRGWVRVVPDGSATPIIDDQLGRPERSGRPDVIDVPVLTDCVQGKACERGYWIILQSFSAEPPRADNEFRLPAIETISWNAAVVAWGAGAGTGGLSVVLDQRDDGLSALTTLQIETHSLEMTQSDAARAVEVSLTFERPAPVGGLDPTVAGMMLIPLLVDGVDVSTSLSGDGATPIKDFSRGRHFGYLLGHPADACAGIPAGSACTMRFRLIVDVPPRQDPGRVRDGAHVDWAMRIHAVPRGTTFAVADPVNLPRPARLPDPLLILGLAALLATAALVVRRSRRRRSEADDSAIVG